MKIIGFKIARFFAIFMTLNFFTGCNQKVTIKDTETQQAAISTLEKEIELRLREYENYLKNGDSIALGNMYMDDAEIIPSIVGREHIIRIFSRMIQDSTTGAFKTTNLWGNDELLVEEGSGVWSHKNGGVLSSGKYLLVWKKDDGKWKILRDTWFPDKKE